MKIILDTNFLVYCAKQKIDYAEDIRSLVQGKYDLFTLDQVILELKDLMENSKKYTDRVAAGLALKLLEVNDVKTVKGMAKSADKSIILLAKGNIVATLDLALTRRLTKTIIIKGKRKLVFR